MSTFPESKTTTGAGASLALAHYILCSVNSGRPLDLADEKIVEASRIGAQGCGESLTDASFDKVAALFKSWYSQDHIDLTHVFDSLVAAATTLTTNWRTVEEDKERLLVALEALANGQHTDFGQQSLRAVERHLGID